MASLFVFLCSVSFALEVPRLDGGWWRIAPRGPDVSPYNNLGVHMTKDFTIYQAADGTWQLVACIADTTYPGSTRLFYRWESTSLTSADWTPQGIFWTTDMSPPGYTQGRLQAPHCFRVGNLWYMFHNSGGAHCLISTDGKNFTQHYDLDGDITFYAMSRDTMILDNRSVDGLWYAYFLQNGTGGASAYVAARTAAVLEGPWSGLSAVNAVVNPESPFVMWRNGLYYQWLQMSVWASADPMDFDGEPIIKMTPGSFDGYYAPEVIEHNGEYFVAGYNNDGVWLCRMRWTDPGEILIDNLDPQFSYTGAWVNRSEGSGFQGADFRTVSDQASYGVATATYAPATANGTYDVYVRYSSGWTTPSNSVRYTVNHASGSAVYPVNQQSGGGTWVLLGRHTLNANSTVVVDGNTGDGQRACADAVRFTPVVANEVIVDNDSSLVTFIGAWWNVTLGGGYHGANFRTFNDQSIHGVATARYSPNLAGSYDVYVRYATNWTWLSSGVRYTVNHASGNTNYTVNQKTGGGAWVHLGRHTLNSSSSVVIDANTNDGNRACADAIRFVP